MDNFIWVVCMNPYIIFNGISIGFTFYLSAIGNFETNRNIAVDISVNYLTQWTDQKHVT
jgi:hypothetical protein